MKLRLTFDDGDAMTLTGVKSWTVWKGVCTVVFDTDLTWDYWTVTAVTVVEGKREARS